LLISQGNIEWLPKANSVNKKRLTWVQFAALIENEGKTVKVKIQPLINPPINRT